VDTFYLLIYILKIKNTPILIAEWGIWRRSKRDGRLFVEKGDRFLIKLRFFGFKAKRKESKCRII